MDGSFITPPPSLHKDLPALLERGGKREEIEQTLDMNGKAIVATAEGKRERRRWGVDITGGRGVAGGHRSHQDTLAGMSRDMCFRSILARKRFFPPEIPPGSEARRCVTHDPACLCPSDLPIVACMHVFGCLAAELCEFHSRHCKDV